MQHILPLDLNFHYDDAQQVRVFGTNDNPLFVAADVCRVLEVANSRDSLARLDDDEKGVVSADTPGGPQKMAAVTESGLYRLIFTSRKQSAERFKRWLAHEVIPTIRKTGSFGVPRTHSFIRRFNENWDRVEQGYFSVISELFIRVYGRFEQAGHQIAEKAPDGTGVRPDVSVGRTFSDWLAETHPEMVKLRKTYRHKIDGIEVEAFQYPHSVLGHFIVFIEDVWMVQYAPKYFEKRDYKALQLLPRLLPPPKKKPAAEMGRLSKSAEIDQAVKKLSKFREDLSKPDKAA